MAVRAVTRKEELVKFIEILKRKRLITRARIQASARVGVVIFNNKKPLVNRSKQALLGLPGFFHADLLAELTEEDRFLGPMKKAIVNRDLSSFKKLGAYMAQFWSKVAGVNNCVIFKTNWRSRNSCGRPFWLVFIAGTPDRRLCCLPLSISDGLS